MNRRPYIGITDFTDFEQVKAMLKVFRDHRPRRGRRVLHVGVMMSYKTLSGFETKWSPSFPPNEKIRSIFGVVGITKAEEKIIYRCLHYADYDNASTCIDLARGMEYAGFLHALQIDMPWPDPAFIANGVHISRNHPEVILQVGKNAIEAANNDPKEVVRRLEDYDGVIHRVLLDKSMGRGVGMDAAGLIPFARAIKERFPHLGLVAAGGLGPGSVSLVKPLLEEFPDISIDAQGKLRPSGNALDPIDWDMAGQYLKEALELLK